MIDSKNLNEHEIIKKNINNLLIDNNLDNFNIITTYNWGGTICGLWKTYDFYKNYNHENYIAFFEEDFNPINNLWLEDSIKLLNTDKYIYIGEHIPSISNPECNFDYKKVILNDKRLLFGNRYDIVYKEYKLNINDSVYTDGGYYFSSIKKFHEMELKIGRFHKGNMESQYSHVIDGVILGEVGFPSQVYLHFNFIGLVREKYFIHN